ncbi:hypothetical protein RhiirA1_43257 [Rhizophagus irregularis]|uniref:Uncharacterized protein n=1 Tax=Rhizophagus irregularis TaxID=588596 RepID=A0A2N0S9D3_9GLOM|nr:hypothetical protein RhiirA1_43257 [Rhizophagus irregularis]
MANSVFEKFSSTGTSIIIHQPSHKDLDNLIVGIASKNKAYEKISEDIYNIINKQTEFSSSLFMRNNYYSEAYRHRYCILYFYKHKSYFMSKQMLSSP